MSAGSLEGPVLVSTSDLLIQDTCKLCNDDNNDGDGEKKKGAAAVELTDLKHLLGRRSVLIKNYCEDLIAVTFGSDGKNGSARSE